MTSSRPYLLRAIYQWIVDNECTPFLLVNATAPGVEVPEEYVENDKIILNVGPAAAQNLDLSDDHVCFNARFGGRSRTVMAPIGAVLAIYARENGQGMLFTDEVGDRDGSAESPESAADRDQSTGKDGPASSAGKPNLRVIK